LYNAPGLFSRASAFTFNILANEAFPKLQFLGKPQIKEFSPRTTRTTRTKMKISVEKSVWSVVNLFKTRRFLLCFGREKVNAVALSVFQDFSF
jgi:hypothetical protein